MLAKRKQLAEAPAQEAAQQGGLGGLLGSLVDGALGTGAQSAGKGSRRPPISLTEQVIANAATSMARTVGTQVGRAILRNVLGSMMKGR